MIQSLTAVGFSCTKLNALSLAGCRGLTSLELRCPYLEQVSLDGCDHLERASFCPVSGIYPSLFISHMSRYDVSFNNPKEAPLNSLNFFISISIQILHCFPAFYTVLVWIFWTSISTSDVTNLPDFLIIGLVLFHYGHISDLTLIHLKFWSGTLT